MENIEFVKATVKLQALHRNVPDGDIEEQLVADYSNVLRSLEKQTGISFEDFLIPNARLKRHVSSYTRPSRFNRFQGTSRYTDSRYCDRDYFLMQLEAAMAFLDGLQSGRTDPIKMKIAILKAVNDKFDGEYKDNLIPSAELRRTGAVESYLGIEFDEDMRHLAAKCFDQLRESDFIRSTYSTNRDRDNWVKITRLGRQAIESGHIDESDDRQVVQNAEVHIKFGIPLEASFDAQLRSCVNQYELVSVLFIDLDNFKAVNDDFDHEVGDQVIRDAIGIIESAIKGKGQVFHRSGDEMLILLPNFDDHEATSIGERIRKSIKTHDFSNIGQGRVTVTIGISTYPTGCHNWEDLKVTADRTAMQAKKSGKDTVAHFELVEV